MNHFIYIDNRENLENACRQWNNEKELGIDIECENNLHHYGSYISIIQISTINLNWVVDVIKIKDISPLIRVFQNKDILKIFHDLNFDMRALKQDFDCKPRNLFDTKIAALFLGRKELGLGSLLKEFFDIEKKSKFQMADWTKRPLSKEMLEYATSDTKYLIPLKNILKSKLEKIGRYEWVKEELRIIENNHIEYKEMSFKDIRNYSKLSDHQRALLKRFYDVRERIAKRVDKPVHFVINSKKLIELTVNPPKSLEVWFRLTGVHPAVKRNGKIFMAAIEKARNESISIEFKPKKRLSIAQRNLITKLYDVREKIAEKLNVEKHVVLSKEQIKEMVINEDVSVLRKWQKNYFLSIYNDLMTKFK